MQNFGSGLMSGLGAQEIQQGHCEIRPWTITFPNIQGGGNGQADDS